MLEVLSKFICSIIMCVIEFIIGKKIVKSEIKLFELRTILLIVLVVIAQVVVYNVTYNISNIMLTFLINIIFFKVMFKIKLEEAAICCGLYTVILVAADIFVGTIMNFIFTLEEIRINPFASIITNLLVGLISILLVNNKLLDSKFDSFLKMSTSKKQITNGIFILLEVGCFFCLFYNVSIAKVHNIEYLVNIIIIVILSIIAYIFIQGKIKYNQLSEEYNTLFSYVQNFEEWIEREQLNRHEYKNQLAVLRSITSDKSVINKINGILNDNVSIKGDTVHKLKELPKGGLKGLMYYKVAIAQKQNINVEVDVSIKKKSVFNKLNESKIKVLCNLIGIYFDNAIEAAVETKKKSVSLEIYEINDGIKIVISNTFKQSENFEKRNERGVTTKGQGHGNGLYYASNLISRNNWLETSQELIEDFYIQNITIKN